MAKINMAKLAEQMQRERDTILSVPYEAWLHAHRNQPYPEWVVARIAELLQARSRDRHASFGGSEAGLCLRRQELGFIGLDSISRHLSEEFTAVIDTGLLNIFNDGTWRHLRWQANLLTAGIVSDIEYPLHWRSMRSRGTVDAVGIVQDDHPREEWRGKFYGVELKGMNSWPYRKYVEENAQMEKHKGQFSRYFLSGGFDLFVVLYEEKDTNQYKEWVFEPDPQLMADARTELEKLNSATDARILHPPLKSCTLRIGKAWKDCPFAGRGGICERMDTWPIGAPA